MEEDFYFAIHDRWGELLYESDDLYNKAWDGMYKGVMAKDDQYVYQLIVKSKYSERIEEFNGSFQLIK